MGNHALRKQAALLLKGTGVRLYIGNKLKSYKYLNAWELKNLIDMLNLKPGELVSDCDAFNHYIKEVIVTFEQMHKCSRAFVTRVKFTDEKLSCGCPGGPMPPRSRDEIEDDVKTYVKNRIRDADWDFLNVRYRKDLHQGIVEHICAEDGTLLPEYEE